MTREQLESLLYEVKVQYLDYSEVDEEVLERFIEDVLDIFQENYEDEL